MKHIDGVRIIEDIAYIKDWLKVNGYKDRDELKNDMICEGFTEEEFEEEWNKIWDEFENWCIDNNIIAQEI
ncbi:MAG: hypothetical protein ACM3O3_13110 [Syntrophothermus sp.]